MSLKNRVGNFVKKVYDKLQEKSFLEESRMRKQDFTRSRKMNFLRHYDRCVEQNWKRSYRWHSSFF